MLLFALLTTAAVPQLDVPIRCAVGQDCLIQKLFDLDPGPARRDYRCGTLTTDGHDGIDIRLRDRAAMERGVAVLAAADGIVLRTRDGEPDRDVRAHGVAENRQAGNGVVIDHGNGWETQYSHLRRGSVRVTPGQRVRAGEPLGLVGMSGNTEYPHLHFTVRRAGRAIDPFGGVPGTTCTHPGQAIWSAGAAARLRYDPTAIIKTGFAPARPQADRARTGSYDGLSLARDMPIVMWADALGVRSGDRQRVTIQGPDGMIAHRGENIVESGGLSWFGFSGARPPAGGWRAGHYSGRYEIVREGKVVATGGSGFVVE